MRNKKLYYLATLIVTSSMLVFTGCSKRTEPVISESVEQTEPAEEPATPSNQGDNINEVVKAEKLVEAGDPANGSDVAGMDNEDGLTDEEINAEVIDEEDSIESEYTVIPMEDTQMFATSNANIRRGPSTDYEKAGSLTYAQEITVNGKVESGGSTWYVIKTGNVDDVQMVSGSLLSTTKPVQQKPAKPAPQQPQQPSGGETNVGGMEVDGELPPGAITEFDWGTPPDDGQDWGLH